MGANIIWLASLWLCAAIFTGFGIYAGKRKKPVWFWSGTTVDSNSISDIPAYNKENKKLWLVSAAPFWILGLSHIWFPMFSTIAFMVYGISSLIIMVLWYRRIERKYKI